MSGQMPFKLGEISEEEEAARERELRRRNKTTLALLVVFVALVLFGSIFMIIQTGFVPLDNIDLFRSS